MRLLLLRSTPALLTPEPALLTALLTPALLTLLTLDASIAPALLTPEPALLKALLPRARSRI
jgi:hypothetical protein